MSRKIYIDCGSNRGRVTNAFITAGNDDFEYFLFEPLPKFNYIQKLLRSRYPSVNLTYSNDAVYIEDGTTTFHISTKSDVGSTLVSEKKSGREDDKPLSIDVRTIDFSKFMKENFSKDDYIILKMDIEGAEYVVLNKMIKDGTILYCNKMIVEFHHARKFGGQDTIIDGLPISQHYKNIVQYCKDHGIELVIWH